MNNLTFCMNTWEETFLTLFMAGSWKTNLHFVSKTIFFSPSFYIPPRFIVICSLHCFFSPMSSIVFKNCNFRLFLTHCFMASKDYKMSSIIDYHRYCRSHLCAVEQTCPGLFCVPTTRNENGYKNKTSCILCIFLLRGGGWYPPVTVFVHRIV